VAPAASDRDEFDQRYEQGAHRRRMMVTNVHAESPAPAGRLSALARVLTYAKSRGDVWYAQEDEIARLVSRAGPPAIGRSPPSPTDLPGPTV
jgi:peptidoglycan/xylan/chitin deacetylase (PgdA/CDA1 family)